MRPPQQAENGLVTDGAGEGPGSPQGLRDMAVGASSPLTGMQALRSAFPDAPQSGAGMLHFSWRRSRPQSAACLARRGHRWGRGLPLAGVKRLLSGTCPDSLLLYWRLAGERGPLLGPISVCTCGFGVVSLRHVQETKRSPPRIMVCIPLALWSLSSDFSTFRRLLVLVSYETPRVLVVFCVRIRGSGCVPWDPPGVRVVLGRRNEEERV